MPETEAGIIFDPHMALANKVAPTDWTATEFNKERFHGDTYDKLDALLADMAANYSPSIIFVKGDVGENEASDPDSQDAIDEVQANIAALNGKVTTKFPLARLHYVLGNWDLYWCNLAQFVASVTYGTIDHDGGEGVIEDSNNGAKRYYSFDYGGIHFIVLDTNCDSDGNHYDGYTVRVPGLQGSYVSALQKTWLAADLAAHSSLPTIVLSHDHLGMNGTQFSAHYRYPGFEEWPTGYASSESADEVRAILEAAGNVLAVISGHYHPGGVQYVRGGIWYLGGRGMIWKEDTSEDGETNNSYAVLTVKDTEGGDVKIAGEYECSLSSTYRNYLVG